MSTQVIRSGRTRGTVLLASMVAGLTLGYTVTRIGFADFGEVHAMFTFQDTRMLFAFVGAVALIVVAFLLLRVRRTPGRIHAGVVPGAVLFGTGWAISGGCPAIPIVQVAAGYLPAVVTIGGIAVGMYLSRWANARYLHVDRGSCGV
jgi:uncharacterized membrane protein YedE/YeeE